MADTPGQTNIRGLEIDRVVKGFAQYEYIFKNDLTQASTTADSIRYYTRTSDDLTATSPMTIGPAARLALPTYLEPSVTRNTAYVKKYFVAEKISLEDIKLADISVLTWVLEKLTRAVVKKVDSDIWNAISNNRINDGTTNLIVASGAWVDSSADPLRDINRAKKYCLVSGGYNMGGSVLYINPNSMENLMAWLIKGVGSSIPAFSSGTVESGVVTRLGDVTVKVSPNVTADYALLFKPGAATWFSAQDITSTVIDDPGVGSEIRVFQMGTAVLHDPKAVCIISNVE